MSSSGPISVKDKVVLVTGANRGIGKVFVEVLLQHGVSKVYAGVRTLETAQCFAGETRVVPLYMDLSQPSSIQQAAQQSLDVDIVVNNAGLLSRTTPLDESAAAILEETHASQCNHRRLFKSIRWLPFVAVTPEVSAYCASKAAAYSMTQALRQTTPNVRFVSVHPGPIRTEMIVNASAELAAIAEPPEQVVEEVIAALASLTEVFHVFPDTQSKNLHKVLKDYTKVVIEDGKSYGV